MMMVNVDMAAEFLLFCSTDGRQIFRDFFHYIYTMDTVEEHLSSGQTVPYIYEKCPTFIENCDLSQCALMSDTDRKAAELRASEILFNEVITVKQIKMLTNLPELLATFGFITEKSNAEQIILRTLQASNKTAAQFLASFLASYKFFICHNPKGLVKVFKCLVALGFDPSGLMSAKRMLTFPVCTAYWRSQPQLSLKHLARQAVRDVITTNVVHAAPRLGLPASLQSYLLLEDILECEDKEVFVHHCYGV